MIAGNGFLDLPDKGPENADVTLLPLPFEGTVSYGKGTKKVQEDRGLINYLMRHRHTTPFEMCEIKYHVKLPIFVVMWFVWFMTSLRHNFLPQKSSVNLPTYPKGKRLWG